MDADLLTTITGLAGAAKTSIEAIRAALGTKGRGAEKALAPIADLQARVFELQEVALRLQRELAEAQEENAKLRTQIRQKEEGAAERQNYQRKQIGQSTVLARDDEPGTYYCTTCQATHGRYVPLQPMPRNFRSMGSHRCTVCNTIYQL
jgi:chromosome segregation ATPase